LNRGIIGVTHSYSSGFVTHHGQDVAALTDHTKAEIVVKSPGSLVLAEDFQPGLPRRQIDQAPKERTPQAPATILGKETAGEPGDAVRMLGGELYPDDTVSDADALVVEEITLNLLMIESAPPLALLTASDLAAIPRHEAAAFVADDPHRLDIFPAGDPAESYGRCGRQFAMISSRQMHTASLS
jgi:hypothetical protein